MDEKSKQKAGPLISGYFVGPAYDAVNYTKLISL
jgi:hypothetical protein